MLRAAQLPASRVPKLHLLIVALAVTGITILLGSLFLRHFRRVFALNDTTYSWLFSTDTASNYTYNSDLITIDNDGARPATGTNYFSNPSFQDGTTGWLLTAVAPAGWVGVPGNSELYSTGDFLAMKYEAKSYDTQEETIIDDGWFSGTGLGGADGDAQTRYRAVSTATGRPWVNIAQSLASSYDAIEACNDAYQQAGLPVDSTHLITNNEWMTIARNLEQVDSNWTNGAVNNGALFRGNSNSGASLDGSDPLSGINTRTHTLDNGEVIWDMAGNVWSWLSDTINTGSPDFDIKPVGGESSWVEWTTVSNYGSLTYNDFRPSNDTWNSTQGVGRYYEGSRVANTYGFRRSGLWSDSTNAGVFSLIL